MNNITSGISYSGLVTVKLNVQGKERVIKTHNNGKRALFSNLAKSFFPKSSLTYPNKINISLKKDDGIDQIGSEKISAPKYEIKEEFSTVFLTVTFNLELAEGTYILDLIDNTNEILADTEISLPKITKNSLLIIEWQLIFSDANSNSN